MTVVITLSDCPARLRGDITKWFAEINTGVYVGSISARVRDEVWDRITENIGRGHATMVFGALGEQHMDFRVHNAYWEPVDYDGIKLMRRPDRMSQSVSPESLKTEFSRASKRRMAAKKKNSPSFLSAFLETTYVVLDFETTGLDEKRDEIIEIAAILVERGIVSEKMQNFVRRSKPLPVDISRLTGITDDDLQKEGVDLDKAILNLKEFAEDLPFVCHNASFEQEFLSSACKSIGEDPLENKFIDTLAMARVILPDSGDYRLSALADRLKVSFGTCHRALSDCETTYGIYCKLIELAAADTQKSEK